MIGLRFARTSVPTTALLAAAALSACVAPSDSPEGNESSSTTGLESGDPSTTSSSSEGTTETTGSSTTESDSSEASDTGPSVVPDPSDCVSAAVAMGTNLVASANP